MRAWVAIVGGVLIGGLAIAGLAHIISKADQEAIEQRRQEWPERCRKECRARAVESPSPREAHALCLEGCP